MKTSNRRAQERLSELKQLVEHERTRTYERIRELRQEQREDAEPAPGDELDTARSLAEIETVAGLIERAEFRLAALDTARSNIEQNRYGICEECGEEIALERLRVLPFAAYCVDCQRKLNQARLPGQGWIDDASARVWGSAAGNEDLLERADALTEPEERLEVRENTPFGPEAGEFEQLPPTATARRRGRVRTRRNPAA
jgi:DnaK suppressor protein